MRLVFTAYAMIFLELVTLFLDMEIPVDTYRMQTLCNFLMLTEHMAIYFQVPGISQGDIFTYNVTEKGQEGKWSYWLEIIELCMKDVWLERKQAYREQIVI